MAKFRSCENFSFKNASFVSVVIILLLSFALLVYQFFIREQQFGIWFILISVFYALAMWSYLGSVLSNPGAVPVYFGLYTEDIEGQRKYCLICHNFKPQRSHHCSKCNQCVLNMDHHCPWINNCVGFDNRKYFVLFITYLLIAISLALVWMGIVLVRQITSGTFKIDVHAILRILLFCKYVFLEVTLSIFTITHYRYIANNTTTIEQMILQRKRKTEKNKEFSFMDIQHNVYDINPSYNFIQVFGENPFYWFLPIAAEKPLRGGGVKWDKNKGYQSIQFKEETKY